MGQIRSTQARLVLYISPARRREEIQKSEELRIYVTCELAIFLYMTGWREQKSRKSSQSVVTPPS